MVRAVSADRGSPIRIVERTGSGRNIVLWVSRHTPLKAQIEELKRKIPDIMLVQVSLKIPSAEYLYYNIKAIKAKYVVPILPLSFLRRLLKLAGNDIIILWPIMRELHVKPFGEEPCSEYDTERDIIAEGYDKYGVKIQRHYRFQKFSILKDIKLILEEF